MGASLYAVGGTRIFFNNNGHGSANGGGVGDGWLDLGNLTTLDLTNAVTKLDHKAFIAATRSMAKDLTLNTDTQYGLTCNMDELGAEQWNIISSGAGTTTTTQSGGTPTNERHLAPALLDRSVFSDETNYSSMVITGSNSTPTYTTADYTLVNAVTGEVKILASGSITASLPIFFNYTSAERITERIVIAGDSVLQGSARVHYQGQNGEDMTWILNNCLVSVENLTLSGEAFSEAPLTLDALVDKITPAEPFGYRLIG